MPRNVNAPIGLHLYNFSEYKAKALAPALDKLSCLQTLDLSINELVEQDSIDLDNCKGRHGLPQDIQQQVILEKSRQNIETLFPGFTQACVEQGAQLGDRSQDFLWYREFVNRTTYLMQESML